MAVRAQRRGRLVALNLLGMLVVLGLLGLAPQTSSAVPARAAATASPEPDVPHHPVLHHPPPPPCAYAVTFADERYCPATPEGLSSTRYGVGRRVYLTEAIVDGADAAGLSVSQQRGPVCDEGTCDFYLESVWVPWSGSLPRPDPGSVIELYGRTTKGSLSPVDWIFEGTCDDPWSRPC